MSQTTRERATAGTAFGTAANGTPPSHSFGKKKRDFAKKENEESIIQ